VHGWRSSLALQYIEQKRRHRADEALEYEWFLDGVHPRPLLQSANHMLFTLLAKPIVWPGKPRIILAFSESPRTASNLLATYLLCRRLFGGAILFFSPSPCSALDPQILDFMAAARDTSRLPF